MKKSRETPARRGAGAARRKATREVLHGLHPIAEALSSGRRALHTLLVRSGSPRPELVRILAAAKAAGVEIRSVPAEALTERLGSDEINHQGALLEVGPLPELEGLGPLLSGLPAGPKRLIALDGVEDPQNVGAIARVADASGAGGLLLTKRRAPPLSPALSRASAGAIEWLPVARVANLARALEGLKARGLWVVGADPESGDSLFDVPDRVFGGDLVVVVGAEGAGLRPSTLAQVDHRLIVPMQGRVASLNVATATAVVLFEIGRRSARLKASERG